MIKQIAAINLALGAMGSLILFFIVNQNVAITCLATSILLVGNLMGLYFFWRIIFFKKSIALAVLVIIFKYLLLGMFLWTLANDKSLNPAAFCIGLGSLIFAALTAVLVKTVTNKSI